MTGIPDPHHEFSASSASGQGPGRLVRQAREQLKLSLEDLAAQIKLARITLDAIERDDFAQLNEPVYVRGYYRKLAKVLPVPEAELIAAYERVAGQKAPPHPSKLILAGGQELGSGRRISLKLAVGVIVLGLVIGGLAFWGKNRVSPVVQPVVTPASNSAVPVESDGAAAVPTPAPEGSASPLPESQGAAPVTATPSAPVSQPATTPQASAASAVGAGGALQLQFDGSSWAEIKDATGRVLLSGLLDAGSSQSLDGRPPFVVFLGNAPVVRISYNGQPVDTAQFRRGDNTARITLP